MEILNNLVQGETAWLEARAGKVSGTKLASVMAGPKAVDTFMYDLLAEKLAPLEENFTTPAMQRGTDLEPFAIMEYERLTGETVSETGLIKRDNFNICSPDGIIYNEDGIITKAVEVKCLAARKQLKYMSAGDIHGIKQIEKLYFWQVVNYFLVIDTLEELTFFLYNPQMYNKDLIVHQIKVTRKELEIDIRDAYDKLNDFQKKFEALEQNLLNK